MNFAWPIQPPPKSTAGQLFGARGVHTGLDMGTRGDAVLAPAAGEVEVSTLTSDARGRMLKIKHDSEYTTQYYHLDSAAVKKGESVTQGQTVAVAGMTGLKKAWPHLHFEVLQNGKNIDPLTVLPARSTPGLGLVLILGLAAVWYLA